MKESDRKDFARYLAGVYALKRADLTPMLAEVWFRAMHPFELSAVLDAINRHVVDPDHGQYLPTPADIVRLIQGGSSDRAILAWDAVTRAISRAGIYQSVVFDDPIIMRCLSDMGGWVKLNNTLEKELPFVAREFQNRYRAHTNTGRVPDHPRVLHGICDLENLPRGYPEQTPVLIGELRKALAVYKGGLDHAPAPQMQRLPTPDLLESRT